jgi:hypothetical protein
MLYLNASQTYRKTMDQLAVYVVVYEHKGLLFPGYTREFMRHSSILIGKGDGFFDVFHVTGTPGIGLTFSIVRNWSDPRRTSARLLSMVLAARIPTEKYSEMESLIRGVGIEVSRTWNCQNWVQEGLAKMVTAGLLTGAEKDAAIQKQMTAVLAPFTTETPNAQAL